MLNQLVDGAALAAGMREKANKIDVPVGFTLLPGGVTRRISANGFYIRMVKESNAEYVKSGRPWRIETMDAEGGDRIVIVQVYRDIRPVGPIEFKAGTTAKDASGCTVPIMWIETTGPILVRV